MAIRCLSHQPWAGSLEAPRQWERRHTGHPGKRQQGTHCCSTAPACKLGQRAGSNLRSKRWGRKYGPQLLFRDRLGPLWVQADHVQGALGGDGQHAEGVEATPEGEQERPAELHLAEKVEEAVEGVVEGMVEGVEEVVEPVVKAAVSSFRNRVIFGTLIGVSAGAIVVAGGWWFTALLALVQLLGSLEFFGLLRAKGFAQGMTPPSWLAVYSCTLMNAAFPLLTMYYRGRMGVAMTAAAFVLVLVLLLQPRRPRFSQVTSSIFGLFYCGYLPAFWVKLRNTVTAPLLHTPAADRWPLLLGGRAHLTVGLLATLLAFACIIAADTGAYLGGKRFGRTPLIAISPKKTVEGALFGLASAVSVAVALGRIFHWPVSVASSASLAVLIFFASLFGDLTESMIKRDAEVKDSGNLIPGHGGILDRADSYIFTGALVYSFVKLGLPLYGL